MTKILSCEVGIYTIQKRSGTAMTWWGQNICHEYYTIFRWIKDLILIL